MHARALRRESTVRGYRKCHAVAEEVAILRFEVQRETPQQRPVVRWGCDFSKFVSNRRAPNYVDAWRVKAAVGRDLLLETVAYMVVLNCIGKRST